jgi:hypothetical protein
LLLPIVNYQIVNRKFLPLCVTLIP